ncbi:cytochrome aa3 quinol oxidase subunit IV [Staphylococcus sp. 18_1_E_LY]|jgi:cytochrome aa3-600 menaquinol oxidase subunit 4|uniref:Quinol oxidase subunit 4 n=2 Tax=Staphylococcus TaxID=1279 RepID=A0A151A5Z1_9STAP|nr:MULTISPECIES: cytochrome aa3 quinol oxidase subunit IV [Staphylococcus]AVQ36547.1 cytochrome aa3 quinol oxidase subunit IV [Staphylococcus kloosii]KYH14844.1 cytochrome aa3 quinol oxidase subunit IV [Staphylococcus kloosii]MBF7019039.1 cytochrome aa3 quinol oxidase subunit IV [Staphylococcus lloydii]MBF7022447.1 cytochrome aa3 quinol oxidase subunit IV [Staphylococcus kloosii]MBF7026767.1 cytochrome aa3 quinol oxidase subunit IV [Staphylococcus lloydii]
MNTIVKHTVGFIASIVLTLLAVFVTLYTSLTLNAKITIIFGFAFVQAAVQLLMFMHLTEGKDGNLQSFKVIFAIIITLIIIIGTYWVMQGGHSHHL